ncbi:MAG: metalloregulator ArsR/SmtB family transcription factor, partial [Myxococcota bacterium]
MGSLHTASRATSPASGEVEVELPRWDLYRLLADPIRLRLLALTAVEELAVSELAELLGERQPKVSRQTGALRDAGVLHARRRGSWLLLRLRPDADRDPVLGDALRTGRQLCEADGSLARVASILQRRDEATRAFFERSDAKGVGGPPSELGNYLRLLAPMLPHRSLAVDAGTGDGSLLEVLCPLFGRVIAVDRAEAQLEQAR